MSLLSNHKLSPLVFKSGVTLTFERPHVMGILNVTTDSFSEIGRYVDPESALKHALKMVVDGASILDVGAEPTNPRVNPITSLQQELDSLLPILELLAREISIPISVDTSKPEVMQEAVKGGASMINDVRALRRDGALTTIAELQVPVCLMHMVHPDGSKQLSEDWSQGDIISTIKAFFTKQIDACIAAGIGREKLILDPGIGHGNFGKNLSQNLLLLQKLAIFSDFELPILVGVSRKTFIGELFNMPPEDRLVPSIAAAVIAAEKGAAIIRVHDVKETVQALRLLTAIQEEGSK